MCNYWLSSWFCLKTSWRWSEHTDENVTVIQRFFWEPTLLKRDVYYIQTSFTLQQVYFFLILQLRWPIESTFSQTVILCICWDTPSEKTGIWQLPKVSSAFKVCFHFARHISPCSLFIKPPRRRLLAPVAYDAQHAGFFESVEPTAVSTHNKHVIDMIPTLRNNITIYHKVYLPSSWHRLVK